MHKFVFLKHLPLNKAASPKIQKFTNISKTILYDMVALPELLDMVCVSAGA